MENYLPSTSISVEVTAESGASLNANTLHPVLTVSQLTAQIREVLEDCFNDIYIVGETSNAKVYPSGHWYFSLKDKDATLPCVCFKNINQSIKYRLEDGLMLVARGRLSVYPPRGAYQMIVTALEPVGIGEWQLAFEQLKKQLEEEGLLSPERKKAIPLTPKKIGIVTSTAGAAIRDILSALARRNRGVDVVIASAKVQGEGSVDEIVQAITDLQTVSDLEVIIVTRGGGSIEDLWSFNTEAVARAIANCRLPVISGVGHETDLTICDLVADMRAPTPTAAAELVSKGRSELLETWQFLKSRLLNAMTEKLGRARHTLGKLNPLQYLSLYAQRLRHSQAELTRQKERAVTAVSNHLNRVRHNWREASQKLASLGPINIMQRGFAVLRNDRGQTLSSISQVEIGQVLEALLEDGKLKLTVSSKHDDWT